MSWPLSQDYNEAIQSPAANFSDADLKRGKAVCNSLGLPMPYSGNFADVYQVRCPGGSRWAVKCFTREVPGLRERYQEISAWLGKAKLPFSVEFSYLEQGMRVGGQWYPILKMQWVEGLTLNQFVGQYLDKPAMLEALLQLWAKMGKFLRAAKIGHCDLQHGNVLLVPGSTPNALALKLIDYDGMWIPPLAERKTGEVGHANYQHPRRLRERTYSLEVDRFPLLLVATAMRALKADKALWAKYDNGDNLLFKQSDLADPNRSALFQELASLPDPGLVMLAAQVRAALKGSLESTALLEEAMPEGKAPKSAVRPATPPPKANAFTNAGPRSTRTKRAPLPKKTKGMSVGVLVAAAIGVIVLLGGAAGTFVLTRGGAPNKAAAQPPAEWAVAPSRPTDDSQKQPAEPVSDPVTDPDKSASEKPTEVARGPEPTVQPSEEIDANPNGPIGEVRQFVGHTGEIRGLAVSPNGKQLLTASWDKTVRLWDVASGRELQKMEEHTGAVQSTAFLPDGVRALSASEDKTVRLWDLKKGREIRSFLGHTKPVYQVAVSGDGRIAASCGPEGKVFIWDVDAGKEVRRLEEKTGRVESVAVSADGRTVLAGNSQGSICLWDVEKGNELRRFQVHAAQVMGVKFSPVDGFALSGGNDKIAYLWQLADGKRVRVLDGHGQFVYAVAFSSDGGRILTGSADGAVRLWDSATGKELYTFHEHTARVWTVAFSPDGHYAFSAGGDNTAHMWRLPPKDYVQPRSVEASTPVVKKPEPKPAAPDAAALAAADKEIKDVYKAEFAKKKKADEQALAAKLLQKGVETKFEPVLGFALLRQARDLAAKIGDFPLSLRAAGEMADRFDVDVEEMKLQAVEMGARTAATRAANLLVAEAALPLAEEAIDGDEFDRAARYIQIALETSKDAGNPSVRAAVDERIGEIATLRKAYEPVKAVLPTLANKPDDAAANLTLGTYLCLNKGDWSRGLPALAQGSNAKLKALAEADLNCASDPDAQAEMAKKYLAQAEGESGAAKAHLQRRACYWYQRAEAKLTGITKDEATKKIADIAKTLPRQRPAIVCVYFGTANVWHEATQKARSLLLPAKGRNQLVMAGSNQLGVPEPPIPQNKTMVILYQESGQTCLGITPEGKNAVIPAAPGADDTEALWPAPGQELLVLAARYGSEGKWGDATSEVQHLVKGRSLTVTADDRLIGDTFPGKTKTLFIAYRYGNRVRLAAIAQRQTAILGAGAAKP